ncbi:MAG: hypothetical protein JEZ05_02135 [Tenericutes bacterium]|nr:hypothetical protein [Mycoplasmatota bacterium]
MVQDITYYENTYKYRQRIIIAAILFVIGFVIGVCAIIVYHIIKPIDVLEIYQPKGEEFLITIICMVFSILFGVSAYRLNNYVQSIHIDKSDIRLVVKKKEITLCKSDLENFQIRINYLFQIEYILNFKNITNVLIISSKRRVY